MAYYHQLAKGEFRLLSFQDDDGLTLKLEAHKIDKAPPYIALSYRWGPAPYQKGRPKDLIYRVVVEGEQVEVSQNLHDALRYLGARVRRAQCAFWVDAVCINQVDLDEKADQVPRMSHIYQQSKSVYSWIGVPFDDQETKLAVELMRTFSLWLEDSLKQNNEDMDVVIGTVTPDHVGFPSDQTSTARKAWDGIAEMFAQSYWQRAWVSQELTSLTDIRFFCGEHSFSEYSLSAACFFGTVFANFQGFDEDFSRNVGSTSSASRANQARLDRHKGKRQRLLDCLGRMKKTPCTDERDKVFIAVSHATDVVAGQFVIDYHRDLVDVYIDVVRFALTVPDQIGLEILGHIFIPTCDSSNPPFSMAFEPRVPSWVPDWRARATAYSFVDRKRRKAGGISLYDPCPGTYLDARICELELEIKGHVREDLYVTYLTDIWDDREQSITVPRAWYDILTAGKSSHLDQPVRRALLADTTRAERGNAENDYEPVWRRGAIVDWSLLESNPGSLSLSAQNRRRDMDSDLNYAAYGRRMAKMSGGRIALLPAAACLGDQVAAFHGGNCLYLVRPVLNRQDTYNMVGECYVDGLMDGAFSKGIDGSDELATNIRLI